MSNLQAAVRAFATDAAQPAELCQQVNRILCGNIAEGRFISFFYCILDTDLGTLTFCERRPLPADPGSRRRVGRTARRRAVPCSASSPTRRTSRARVRRWRAAIGLVLFTDGITEARTRRPDEADTRIRRGAADRAGGREPRLQRAGAAGAARRRRRGVHRRHVPGRRDADRARGGVSDWDEQSVLRDERATCDDVQFEDPVASPMPRRGRRVRDSVLDGPRRRAR